MLAAKDHMSRAMELPMMKKLAETRNANQPRRCHLPCKLACKSAPYEMQRQDCLLLGIGGADCQGPGLNFASHGPDNQVGVHAIGDGGIAGPAHHGGKLPVLKLVQRPL